MNQQSKIDNEKRNLLSDLINSTREVSMKYNGCKQLVTEEFAEIQTLLNLWERVLSFGLKTSLFNNVQELFNSSSNGSMFWTFAYQFLSLDEQKRFSNFKNLWTDRGKTKALIRNALNENCLERYLLTWINAENLNEYYENYALLRDEKAAILPKLAADISSILFAIKIDVPELNCSLSKTQFPKDEPIIDMPSTSGKVIKSNTKVRKIDEFEETMKQTDALKISSEIKFSNKTSELLSTEIQSPPSSTSMGLPLSIPIEEVNKDQIIATISSDRVSVSTDSSSMSQSNFFDVKNDSDTISHSSISSNEDENQNQNHEIKEEPAHDQPTLKVSNQIENESIMQKQRDRIKELEQQVVDLTLENTRLRNLLNVNKVNTLANFQISIPRAVLRKSKTKNYYVYEINLKSTSGFETWTIFKRYRDFYQLHKTLKNQHLQIKVLDFPPKKKIGNLEFDFVEDRRQRLQVYIRHVLQNLPDLASCESKQLLESKCPFFKS